MNARSYFFAALDLQHV